MKRLVRWPRFRDWERECSTNLQRGLTSLVLCGQPNQLGLRVLLASWACLDSEARQQRTLACTSHKHPAGSGAGSFPVFDHKDCETRNPRRPS